MPSASGKGLISVFQGFSASIGAAVILAGAGGAGVGAELSYYGV